MDASFDTWGEILALMAWLKMHHSRGQCQYGCVSCTAGPCFNMKRVFQCIGNLIIKIRRWWDRLIFMMGIPILARQDLCIETTPMLLNPYVFYGSKQPHLLQLVCCCCQWDWYWLGSLCSAQQLSLVLGTQWFVNTDFWDPQISGNFFSKLISYPKFVYTKDADIDSVLQVVMTWLALVNKLWLRMHWYAAWWV